MQFITFVISGFWITSSSIFLGESPNMSIPSTHIPIEQISDWSLLASIPSTDLPIYHSPSAVLLATDIVVLDDPKKYDKKIYRYGEKSDPVSYAWEQWKDIDFILMIQEESLWDELISWDDGASIGYCQFNRYYSPKEYKQYIVMTDWKSRVDLCHNYYEKYRHIVGEVFHGWNNRKRNLSSFIFR